MKWILAALITVSTIGCTSRSTQLAIEQGQRVEDVQDSIFKSQQNYLRQYLFNYTINMTQEMLGRELTEEEAYSFNKIWNERDDLSKFAVQWERARALRMVTVDTKLIADQHPLDLMLKSIMHWIERAKGENNFGTSQPAP